jgi:hypothetical protein
MKRSASADEKLQLQRILVLMLSLGCSLLTTACSDSASTLEVRVYTGLVPGPEFASIETTVQSASASGPTGNLDSAEARARFGMDFAHGRSVATFGLPDGDYRVRVRLLRASGHLLVERVVAIQLRDATVLPMHLTRDCVGVVCPAPGGSAALSTCLAGRCVDPRCSQTDRAFCPEVTFCNEASECTATSGCASSGCEAGLCVQSPLADICDENEWCNPDPGAGCQLVMPTTTAVPSVCGTICTDAAEPCRFGYWNCDASSPTCVPLQNRPSDFACADGRVCDALGDCTPSVLPDPPGILVTPTSGLSTTEAGGSATFTLQLESAPTASVFVTFSSSDTTEGTVAPSVAAFTTSNWNLPQTISVTGVDDFLDDEDVMYTVASAAAVSADPAYSGLDSDDVAVINTDDDVPAGIAVAPTSGLTTSESGGTATFSVVLLSQPTDAVVVPVASTDTSEGTVDALALTFTSADWNTEQTVTVTGVDDPLIDGEQAYSVTVGPAASADPAYDGFGADSVSVANSDNEMPGVTVNPTVGLVTSEAGSSASFTVVLNARPNNNVTISLASSAVNEGTVSPATLTFTPLNWSTTRTVMVTGVDDFVDDGDLAYTIVTGSAISTDPAYSGMAVNDVSLTNSDDDAAGITITPTSGLVTVAGGRTASFSIVLHSQPTSDVTIGLTSSDTSQGTPSSAALTFTAANWATPQVVTVSGVDDMVDDGQVAVAYTIVTSDAASADPIYAGYALSDVSAININMVQRAYVKASNTGATDRFGISLALSSDGNTLAVGASFEDSGATGVGGDETDNSLAESGAVYVFVRSGMSWSQQAYVKASNTDANDGFGKSLALSADGSTLAVGTEFERSSATGIGGNQTDNSVLRAGAAYVFTRSGTAWTQQAYVKASNTGGNDFFGHDVELSADGDTLVVSAYGEASNATGINGVESNNSATSAGAAYVFTRSGATWTQQAYIKASNTGANDFFGVAIALSADGNRLAVGARQEDSGATGIDGDQGNAAGNAGAVYIFDRSMGTWSQQVYIKASNTDINDAFGWSVAISGDGDTLAVGAQREASSATGIDGNQSDNSIMYAGAVYVFRRAAGVWSQQAYIKASNTDVTDVFGDVVALSADGNTLAVGAQFESSNATGIDGNQADNSAPSSGAVYVFRRTVATWQQQAYVKASNTAAGAAFGYGVSLSSAGNTLAVSAYQEGSASTGVNGDQSDAANFSGAAYVFYW